MKSVRPRTKRFLQAVVLAAFVAGVVASAAGALRFSDESYLTPTGVVGTPYAHRFTGPPPEQEGRGCDPPYSFKIDSGGLPPGLSLSSDGLISGTPTQAGSFSFYASMHDDPTGKETWCNPASAEREFTIKVIGRLVIGPESVGPGTVGVHYSVAMTATLSEPKTWSISAGALPPGLTLGTTSGIIAGTPTTAGSYPFTVRAVVDAERSDTKALTIAVRSPLAVAGGEPFAAQPHVARTEVGLAFRSALVVTGGSGIYTWLLAEGTLPPGIALTATGVIGGRTTTAGTYRFTASVADDEGRRATYDATMSVAPRLAIATIALAGAKVDRLYRARLRASGGIQPTSWRVAGGSLPLGIHLDAARGVIAGTPRQPGRYRVTLLVTDGLGVRSTRALVLVVRG